jgi:adenylate kinase family enzyme
MQTPTLPDALRTALRFNIVGTSGAGKSIFSRRLAEILRAPHIEMDRLFWRANWQQAPEAEFLADLQVALGAPCWVLDGNYSRSIPVKWATVDAVIWLDYPFAVIFMQAVMRALRRAWGKQELWPGTGNRESFRQTFFSRESILWWTIKTFARNRRHIAALMADPAHARIAFIRLRSRAEAAAFLYSTISR